MKFDLSMSTTTPQLSQPVTLSASGASDNANHRMRMKIDMSSFAATLGGSTGGNPKDWRGVEVGDAANGRLVVYMSLPFLTKLLPAHKPWIKMDLTAAGNRLGVDLSQFTSLSANPAQVLDWLRATSGTITKIGSERIGGVETTHYHATIDLRKYPNLVPPARRAAMRRAVAALTRVAHVSTFPVDAWVGDDGLVRKLHVAISETINGQTVGLRSTLRFHDFGTPVTVTLPPAAETFDLSKVGGGRIP
ncbi:MAG TPA: hypothetical protein VE269_06305 [Gaiellaceae bacterium]|nr:hypothetical protein [Gaiellaceae bacterium]